VKALFDNRETDLHVSRDPIDDCAMQRTLNCMD